MNIKKTLTFAVITALASSFAFSADLKSLLTRSRAESASQGHGPGIPGDQFAQAEPPQQTEKPEAKPAEAKPADTKSADVKTPDVLVSAAERLKGYSSIRANMTEKIAIQDKSFTAKGSYLQGQNLQLRLEFTVELNGQKASLLEVCDGQILWSRQDLGEKDQTQIFRRDVRQILQATAEAVQRMKGDEKAIWNASITADLGIGGLPALIAAMMDDCNFSKITETKIDERDVVVLEGTWKSKLRTMWLGAKAKDKTPPPLPVYIPDIIRLSLDKETEFPRRIEYLKALPGQVAPLQLMTVDFTKVVFNGKTSRDDFVFIPPDRPQHVDVTQVYLQRLNPTKAATKGTTPPATEKKGK